MDAALEKKIKEITEGKSDNPGIFKVVLKRELAFVADEEILGLVNIKREYVDKVTKRETYSGAALLVATSFGLIVIEEGMNLVDLAYGGYRIRHIPYSKINCLAFDTCLLLGIFKIILGTGNEPDLVIEFNTAVYYYEFENLIDIVRRKMLECERHQMK